MAKKLLTISIAAYNVEHYIKESISSTILEDYMDYIEVIIVDDGSTDSTERIAKEYAIKWPNSIVYVKKENGGYGSTINYSLKNARGKFFRLLDGDDCFTKQGLRSLIELLSNNMECDAIVSQAEKFGAYNRQRLFAFPDAKKTYNINELRGYGDIAAWGYTFRTEIIRKNWIELPSYTLYTDRIFMVQALKNVNSIYFDDHLLYRYRVGSYNQSTSHESVKKHYKDAIKVDGIVCDLLYNMERHNDFLNQRFGTYYGSTVCMFLELPKKREFFHELKGMERKVKKCYPEVYTWAGREIKRVKLLRYTGYLAFFAWPCIDYLRKRH